MYSLGTLFVSGIYGQIPCIKDIMTIIIIIIIIISKSFRKYVSGIPGNHEVRELQKTAILSTAHILRKVLT
jgi:hypothetical protein